MGHFGTNLALYVGMNKILLENLRKEFRNWYGTISVEELVVNFDLVQLIKLAEKQFVERSPKERGGMVAQTIRMAVYSLSHRERAKSKRLLSLVRKLEAINDRTFLSPKEARDYDKQND